MVGDVAYQVIERIIPHPHRIELVDTAEDAQTRLRRTLEKLLVCLVAFKSQHGLLGPGVRQFHAALQRCAKLLDHRLPVGGESVARGGRARGGKGWTRVGGGRRGLLPRFLPQQHPHEHRQEDKESRK